MLSCSECNIVTCSPRGFACLRNALQVLAVLVIQLVFCFPSVCLFTMASVPQGAFAAIKVSNYRKLKEDKQQLSTANKKPMEQAPLKYNSKMMNSIWGQYNRYSVHNMKKNTDAKEVLLWAEQRLATATPPAFHLPGFTPNFTN